MASLTARGLVLLALAPLPGCVSTSSHPESLGGYTRGESYQARERLALVRSDDGHLVKVAALTTIGPRRSCRASNLFGVQRVSVDVYCGESTHCAENDEDITGTVPAGAIITIRRIVLKKGWNVWLGSYGDDMSIYGDVQYAGNVLENIELTDLSVAQEVGGNILYGPDPQLLASRSTSIHQGPVGCVLASPSP